MATLLPLPKRLRAQGLTTAPADGFRILRAATSSVRLHAKDEPIPVWAYDAAVPGPVLRAKRGEEVKVRLVNALSVDTSIHWHGVRLPSAMDGVVHLTQQPVPPGGNFDYRFTPPDAGTYWYHPSSLTSDGHDRGLHGALIVEESEPVGADRDVVLMLQDWRLDAGPDDRVAANAQLPLELAVATNERLRLRLINGSATRTVSLRFAPHRITVIAIDGQPAEPFVARDSRIVLAPGNRLDLIADMILPAGTTAPIVLLGANGETLLARFIYAAGPPARPQPLADPKPLPANALPARIELRNAYRLDLPIDPSAAPWKNGGAAGGYGAPLFSVKRGRVVTLGLVNRAAAGAVLHLHGHHVRLLDNLDDGWKPFWLDTILVPAGQTARIAFVADNPGKWLIESRMLGQPHAAMAAWFEVG